MSVEIANCIRVKYLRSMCAGADIKLQWSHVCLINCVSGFKNEQSSVMSYGFESCTGEHVHLIGHLISTLARQIGC